MPRYGEALYGQEYYGVDLNYFQKRYVYKVYTDNAYVTTWSSDVVSEPSFTTVINGGAGQLKIVLARPFENFGEDSDVKLNNSVDVYVYDIDNQNGLLLYRGYISTYAPILIGGKEYIEVTLLPLIAQADRFMLRTAAGATSISYLSKDPGFIFADVLSKFQADGGSLQSTSSSIQSAGTTVSYTFNTNTVLEAFKKCVELAPANWYWSVDPNGTINFKQKISTVTHDLSIGQHIQSMKPEKRVESIINRVYFTGGGDPPLYTVYQSSGSISTYGLYATKIVDQRVTLSATAQTIAQKILDEKSEPEVRTKLVITDSNGRGGYHGYDIESIKVGDTIRIKNLSFGTQTESQWDVENWDDDVWDYTLASVAGQPLLVTKTSYKPNSLEVETSSRFPEVSKRIEDINRNLENSQTANNPSSPS